MRADATRNAAKLRVAAAELFEQRGVQVSVKEIARRAGVSHGTLYNLFGSRDALIDDVVTERAAGLLAEIAHRGSSAEDPWDGFCAYLHGLCELYATDAVVADVLCGRCAGADRAQAACNQALAAAQPIIDRAQEAGVLRMDFTYEDLMTCLVANALLARSPDSAPGAWRRHITLLLDGLRTTPTAPPR